MNRWRGAWPLAAALLLPGAALAGEDPGPATAADPFVVIVHPDLARDEITREEVAHIFLGDVRHWRAERPIVPVDLSMSSTTRWHFTRRVLQRSVGEVMRHWRRREDQRRPPKVAASEPQAVEHVARTPGAIGYVSRTTLLEGVAVLPLVE